MSPVAERVVETLIRIRSNSEVGGSLACQPYIPHARRKAEKLKPT